MRLRTSRGSRRGHACSIRRSSTLSGSAGRKSTARDSAARLVRGRQRRQPEERLSTVDYNFRVELQNDKTKLPVRCLTVDFGTQLQGVAGPVPQSFACVNAEEPMHAYASSDVALERMALNGQTERLTRFSWNYA